MPVRAIRGAIQVEDNERDAILDGATEMVLAVLERNQLKPDDLISVVFTATPDLTAEFPAYAARKLGLVDVPLLCATEIAVPGAMPRVLRLLAHATPPCRGPPSGTSTCAVRPPCVPTCPSSASELGRRHRTAPGKPSHDLHCLAKRCSSLGICCRQVERST